MLMEAARNAIEARKTKKRPVTINLDSEAIVYFKQLAGETGITYQSLINLFLVQCAKEKKRPVFR
ncbi:MAG: BrnA antitoxin family protein [Spirochaetaceae bacterium]|nr:BrnA antitoxin family protein [Spirochaetaceae bacterium]MBQ7368012.1 BrnA antitoxin family protein [Spirochaetaceae bacterium]